MRMSSGVLAIVVPPDSVGFLMADVAGHPAEDYLLRELGEVEARVLREGPPTPSDFAAGVQSLTFPLSAKDVDELSDHNVLVVDARAWIPHKNLMTLVYQTQERSPESLSMGTRLGLTGSELTIAVCFARGKISGDIIRLPRTRPGHSLEYVLDNRAIAATVEVSLDPAPSPRPVLLETASELASFEETILLQRATSAMKHGVRLRDPRSVAIRGDLRCGEGVEIDANVIVEGSVVLGAGVRVGANCIIRDSEVGDRTLINPFSLIDGARVGVGGVIGPYARLRTGAMIGDDVQIGNFVEIKSAEIGAGSRINHHAFIGDASLGSNVTIGAGTITCNHDGARINRTIIERDAYIGSNCSLVAPVRVGEGATIGAGSTITSDVPPAKLTVARTRQTTIEKWQRPKPTSAGG